MMSKLVQVCSSQVNIVQHIILTYEIFVILCIMQSGQIHFYNSRTHKRTSKDPRKSPEPASPDDHMSLDLRLNLPCESLRKSNVEDNFTKHSSGSPALGSGDLFMLAFEGDHQEMVATVCTKCHMLVMHRPDHSPPILFKRKCTLLS